MRALKLTCLFNFVALSWAMAQSTSAVGALQGGVIDEQGSLLAGAEVRYMRALRMVYGQTHQLSPAPGKTVVRGKIATGPTGTFVLLSLPVGDYFLCAELPSAPYLDPCKWENSVRAPVTTNVTVQKTLVLKKGVFLKVRVNDPLGLLPKVKDGPRRESRRRR